nr:helix-turn-helix transcriptional regulator [Streptomyces sp. LBUM 1486]
MGDTLGDPLHGQQTDPHHGRDRDAPTTLSFPAQLRRLRQERGLSLTDLARRTHYSKGYLSKIETGAKRPTVDVARLCDQVLGAEGELLRLVRQTQPRDGDPATEADPVERQAAETCPYRGLSAFTPRTRSGSSAASVPRPHSWSGSSNGWAVGR